MTLFPGTSQLAYLALALHSRSTQGQTSVASHTVYTTVCTTNHHSTELRDTPWFIRTNQLRWSVRRDHQTQRCWLPIPSVCDWMKIKTELSFIMRNCREDVTCEPRCQCQRHRWRIWWIWIHEIISPRLRLLFHTICHVHFSYQSLF